MNKLLNVLLILVFGINIILVVLHLINGHTVAILQPKGLIADQERTLLFTAVGIMLIVVVPVFILAFLVAIKYHHKNTKAHFNPEWNSTALQIFLWTFLSLDIAVLCGINWVTAHKLDPHVAIASNTKPLTVQVIALRWKWLFVYPDLGIASLNYLEFPEKTPLNFQLTASDTPMNSFWIPQLGGQIYAMSGMATQTHLIADSTGTYRGSDAEINGAGFADMHFTAKSVMPQDFAGWVQSIKQSGQKLDLTSFNQLAKPSDNNKPAYFSLTDQNLYTEVVTKYMAHPTIHVGEHHDDDYSMPGMKM